MSYMFSWSQLVQPDPRVRHEQGHRPWTTCSGMPACLHQILAFDTSKVTSYELHVQRASSPQPDPRHSTRARSPVCATCSPEPARSDQDRRNHRRHRHHHHVHRQPARQPVPRARRHQPPVTFATTPRRLSQGAAQAVLASGMARRDRPDRLRRHVRRAAVLSTTRRARTPPSPVHATIGPTTAAARRRTRLERAARRRRPQRVTLATPPRAVGDEASRRDLFLRRSAAVRRRARFRAARARERRPGPRARVDDAARIAARCTHSLGSKGPRRWRAEQGQVQGPDGIGTPSKSPSDDAAVVVGARPMLQQVQGVSDFASRCRSR